MKSWRLVEPADAGLTKASRIDAPLRREPVETAARDLSPGRRAGILARDGGQCCYPACTATADLEVDHVVPLALGGRDGDDNLETLCAAHHRQKTRSDARMIAKARRAGTKHRGEYPPSKAKIRSRGFAPTRDWRDDADEG